MREIFSFSFSDKSVRATSFVFFSLLILSAGIFVFADDLVGQENIFQDSDQDGLSNDEEKLYGTNPSVKDSDGDGYSDGVEMESGYDPLKPAPGDKIVKEIQKESEKTKINNSSENGMGGLDEDLTQTTADEIANILNNNTDGEVSLEEVDGAVQKILEGYNNEKIVLPEINVEEIKIKKGPPKNWSAEKKKKREHDDALEYLTVVAYVMANNSPRAFSTEEELNGMITGLANDSITALSSGNMELINQLSETSEKIMGELKDIEVPESMLDTHIKALKIAKYSIQLKGELKPSQKDPLGQIAVLSKIQGLLGVTKNFAGELQQKLVNYGIQEIPLNL